VEDDILERILSFLRTHPGKSLGIILGFLVGLSLITLGLWRTLVLSLATWLGYAIGKWTDDEGKGLKEFLEEKLPGKPDFH